MLTSLKVALFSILAASSIAATSAGAAVDPTAGAPLRAAPPPASFAVEAQARVLRKCEEDLGYGRTGSFGCGG
jgi:hypothetical protein